MKSTLLSCDICLWRLCYLPFSALLISGVITLLCAQKRSPGSLKTFKPLPYQAISTLKFKITVKYIILRNSGVKKTTNKQSFMVASEG